MRPMELTPRLRSVAQLVPQGAKFADIGTDHAYLPVWLLQRGSSQKPWPAICGRGLWTEHGPRRRNTA